MKNWVQNLFFFRFNLYRSIWALLNFLLPEVFGSAGQFEVGLYKLNPVDLTHSLKAPGFNP